MATRQRKIKFTVTACKFFDCNGNTYHSVRITRMSDGKQLTSGSSLKYGYGEHYKQTALEIMAANKWIPVKYHSRDARKENSIHSYERKNGYPIIWDTSYGLKRDAVQNGTL